MDKPGCEAVERIARQEIHVKFAESISIICPCTKSPRNIQNNEKMLKLFCRYSLRTLFFIKKYYEECYRIALKLFETGDPSLTHRYRIENDAYFYLDAAIISFKAISEKNILKIENIKNENIKIVFNDTCNKWHEIIRNLDISFIRNEIVHINEFGLSTESWAIIRPKGEGVNLRYKNWFSESITQDKVDEILVKAELFIKEYIGLIITDIFNELGYPKSKTYYFKTQDNPINLSDYLITKEI